MLGLSCEESTWGTYERSWEMWKDYISKSCRGRKDDWFMNGLESGRDKQIRIVLFIVELYKNKGFRKQRITSVLMAICAKFEAAAEDSSAFESKIVSRAKRGTIGTNEELKEINRIKLGNPTLPMALDMVMKGRELLWVNNDWSATGMNGKGRWLVIGLGFNFGTRIGQLTLTPRNKKGVLVKSDHCLRAGDMRFKVGNKTFKGGEEVRKFLNKGNLSENILKVDCIEFSCLTSKTTRKKRMTNVVDVLGIGRSTEEEKTLLSDLCEWFKFAGTKEGDEVMCRYDPQDGKKRKVVTSSEVRSAIKLVARSMSLPENLFSTKSLRSGLSSHMCAMGRSEAEIQSAGGWVEGSKVTRMHYTHRSAITGSMAKKRKEPEEWTSEQVGTLLDRRSL
jgi:hypothetical protein